jgi:uroporphyrin-III C-methyltransferase/precorrin-2 dehydrogenase/sirohydrochlorin ferrochelatase
VTPRSNETVSIELTSADPEDLTIRHARLLGEADAVCVDGAVPSAIMARARADAERWMCESETCAQGTGCLKAARAETPGQLTAVLRYRPD